MRIAFDLDSTLIPCEGDFPAEVSLPTPFCWWFREPLRLDTVRLLRGLRSYGCEIWLYTTSGRDASYLLLWLLLLGVPLGGVVNCRRHEVLMRGDRYPTCSKYPPAFGINLLIDDSDGVAEEGRRHGFDVLLLSPSDRTWTETVWNAVKTRYRKVKV